MTKEELQQILEKHSLWVKGEEGGVRANLSGADLSKANLSKANLSIANLSRVDLFGANLPEANLSRADLSGADLSKANLSGANLSRADLSKANLSGADLYGASLYEANLSGADLSGADLYRADLSRADLFGTIHENKTKIEFTHQQHIAFYFGLDEIRIGCHVHNIAYWLKNFKKIGKDAGYTPNQISKYGKFIKSCAANYKRSKK